MKINAAVLHPNGNANVREALRALGEGDVLRLFATSVVVRNSSLLSIVSRGSFSRREYELARGVQTVSRPSRELTRLVTTRLPIARLRRLTDAENILGIDAVSFGIDRALARRLEEGLDGQLTSLLGYMSHCSESFGVARNLGIRTVLEAHHAHWKTVSDLRLLAEHRHPTWADLHPPQQPKVADIRADSELDGADVILAPSTQVVESLERQAPRADIVLNPYGCPPVRTHVPVSRQSVHEPLRLVSVGRLELLKGIADVCEFFRGYNNPLVRLTLVGKLPTKVPDDLKMLLADERVDYLGTLPREAILGLLPRHHAFLLPSVIEGRSLAALEAASCGLPLIVTRGSGVEDIVEAKGGVLVSSLDAQSI